MKDDDGVSDSTSRPIQVGATNLPPTAAFTYSPASPGVAEWVRFDGAGSSDPDGTITGYTWSFGDGTSPVGGSVVYHPFAAPGTYLATLTVQDNDAATDSTSRTIIVSGGGGTPGGEPPMGSIPGFFVWGTNSWHITVNAGAGWVGPHNYRIELRTDGSFQDVGQTTDSGSGMAPASPMGILPTPAEGGKTLIHEGSLQTGSIDHTFRIPDSQSMWLHLQLDTDGDGDLETSSGFVYLRYSMVNPPTSPFVVGLPSGSTAELTPSLDFRIGTAISYTATARFVMWTHTISQLEGP